MKNPRDTDPRLRIPDFPDEPTTQQPPMKGQDTAWVFLGAGVGLFLACAGIALLLFIVRTT